MDCKVQAALILFKALWGPLCGPQHLAELGYSGLQDGFDARYASVWQDNSAPLVELAGRTVPRGTADPGLMLLLSVLVEMRHSQVPRGWMQCPCS